MRIQRSLAVLIVVFALVWTEPSQARERVFFQPPAGPRTTQRGKIVIRHGLFKNVYREHWGNGLTPQGAMFLNTAVQTVGPMIPMLAGVSPVAITAPTGDSDGDDGALVEDTDASANTRMTESAFTAQHQARRNQLAEAKERKNRILDQFTQVDKIMPTLGDVGFPVEDDSAAVAEEPTVDGEGPLAPVESSGD